MNSVNRFGLAIMIIGVFIMIVETGMAVILNVNENFLAVGKLASILEFFGAVCLCSTDD